jgi:hypothetical protein
MQTDRPPSGPPLVVRGRERRLRLPLAWHWVQRIRETVAEDLATFEQTMRDAAVMTASELAENAVKYGEPVREEDAGYLSLRVESSSIVVESTNGCVNSEHVSEVLRLIELIDATPNVEILYLERLRELVGKGDQSGGLGLLRIAFEGGFRLSARYTDGMLTITATRNT